MTACVGNRYRKLLRAITLIWVGLAALWASELAAQDRRVALVIGNSEYSAIGRLPNAKRDAARFAETLREMIAGFPFVFQGEQIPCTISIGVAELADERTSADFIQVADGRLYEAKHRGRNRVIAA